jgi:hypothetical protein
MFQGRWLPLSLLLFACQMPNEAPPPATAPPPAPSSNEPAPLPPEETPPPETEAAPPADPKPVEPGITTTGAPTRGTLPKAVIDEKLKGVQPGIKACYENALKQKPELRGSVNINFVVAPDGKVAYADAAQGDDALDDAPTVACILAEIRKLEFPAPKGGRVFINYPVALAPPKATP